MLVAVERMARKPQPPAMPPMKYVELDSMSRRYSWDLRQSFFFLFFLLFYVN